MAQTRSEIWRRYYYKNLESQRQRGRTKYTVKRGSPEGCADNLWRGAKQRSKKKELPFDLTKEWVLEQLKTGKCQVTGIPFNYVDDGAFRFYGATVDRIIPEKGYVKSNCQVVIWGYNAAKGNATHEDVVQLAKAILFYEATNNTSSSSTGLS